MERKRMPKNTRGVQVKQIAEHLGLSSGTVSIVLNGRGGRTEDIQGNPENCIGYRQGDELSVR